MFEKWAEETSKFACEKAHKLTDGKYVAEHSPPVEIDEGTYQEWRSAWLRQILWAGERTAIILNDILDDKGAKKLSEGSKIHTKADDKAEEQSKIDEAERKEWQKNSPVYQAKKGADPNAMQNFLSNLMIAVIVVPCIVLVVQYDMNPLDIKKMIEWLESKSSGGDSDSQG